MKAILNQSIIETHNKETELVILQNYLKQFNRHNCPDRFYLAWKILILGTNEYYDREKQIIDDSLAGYFKKEE